MMREEFNIRPSVKLLLSDRWSVRHMLVEVLAVGLFIYLQFQDKYLSLWAMAAAILSLFGKGWSILTFTQHFWKNRHFNKMSDNNLTFAFIRGINSIVLLLKCNGMETELCYTDLSVYHTSNYSGIFDIRPSNAVCRCWAIVNSYLFAGSCGTEFLLLDAHILHLLQVQVVVEFEADRGQLPLQQSQREQGERGEKEIVRRGEVMDIYKER